MKTPLKIFSTLVALTFLAACSFSSWHTYTNTVYGFKLQYPPGGTIAAGATDTFVRIDLPFIPGTNLSEKYLEISVLTSPPTCQSPLAEGWAPGSLTPTTMTIGGLTWVKENASEGAAGSRYDWTAYSTVSGTTCVNLTFILHSHPPELWPTPPPAFDASAESLVFLMIVDTFEWLGGTPLPTPPPAATSTPTLVPSLTYTPTAAGFFFIPHLNAYCRLGPDPIFDSIALAMKGQSYPIDGRNQDNTYYLILLSKNVECWVLANAGEASGDLSKIRVMLPIPTPTFTPVPQLTCSDAKSKDACLAIPDCLWRQPLNQPGGSCVNK